MQPEPTIWQSLMLFAYIGFFFMWGCFTAIGSLALLAAVSFLLGEVTKAIIGKCRNGGTFRKGER